MTVLVVDDSSVDRENLTRILTELGCDCVLATNGHEAVEQALAQPPEIIFMDIVMPMLDGIAATRELARHTRTKSIPVVFVTSKANLRDKLWGKILGARGYIVKPFEARQIQEQVDRAMQSAIGAER